VDVHIDELHTTVDTIDGSALLTPQTLESIVRAVLRAIEAQQLSERTLRSELDTRSVVDQQREGWR
jgi:hypothetical protein